MSEAILTIMACAVFWMQGYLAGRKSEINKNKKEEATMDGKQVSGEVALQMVSAMSKVADATEELKEARKTLDGAMIEADCADDCFCLIGMSDYIARAHTCLIEVLRNMPETSCSNVMAIDEVLTKIENAKGGKKEPVTMIATRGESIVSKCIKKHCATTTVNLKEVAA